jgi:hypothetical protein
MYVGGDNGVTTFDSHWERYGELDRDEQVSLSWPILCANFSIKIQKEVFSVQELWHSTDTLPTNVHGQAFHHIICHFHRQGAPISHHIGTY